MSISFCKIPIFSFISADACCDAWMRLTYLLRSFFTTSYMVVYSFSRCSISWLRLLRSRMTISLTLISLVVSFVFSIALASSLAFPSRFVLSSKIWRLRVYDWAASVDSSFSMSLFSLTRSARSAALSFSTASSCKKLLMKMSTSRLSSSSCLSCDFWSLLHCCSRRWRSSFCACRFGIVPLRAVSAISALRKLRIPSSFSFSRRWSSSIARFCSVCKLRSSTSIWRAVSRSIVADSRSFSTLRWMSSAMRSFWSIEVRCCSSFTTSSWRCSSISFRRTPCSAKVALRWSTVRLTFSASAVKLLTVISPRSACLRIFPGSPRTRITVALSSSRTLSMSCIAA
mmetsp:Transcript_15234/g.35918  ORF Transcript_15234/g.35918 Transcript_15234/m.35918 type:complete len:342 (+) Transcript_15234:1472-2497(+)